MKTHFDFTIEVPKPNGLRCPPTEQVEFRITINQLAMSLSHNFHTLSDNQKAIYLMALSDVYNNEQADYKYLCVNEFNITPDIAKEFNNSYDRLTADEQRIYQQCLYDLFNVNGLLNYIEDPETVEYLYESFYLC
jgi:hypothetical protein